MTDQYAWYRNAMAGNVGPIVEDDPQPGYYKTKRGDKWLPVAIWYNDDGLVCRVADKQADPYQVWVYAAKNPVDKAAAKQAFETGSWPGDVPQMGDNSGALSLPEEIDDAVEQVNSWLKKTQITDKVSADKAANWRARLLDLSKRADKEREAEKRPHDEAAKAVQAKWKPFIDVAKNTADRIRDALTAYMRAEEAKLRAEQEAKRKAAEEVARKQREAAEAARRDAEANNLPPPPEPEDVPLPLDEPVKVQAGGQRGRKTGLRTITVYEITDYQAALAHVAEHPDVYAAVEKVCRAQAKAGASVPGLTERKEQVAA